MAIVEIPSRNYSPATRINAIPPTALRQSSGVRITLTRENWPVGDGIITMLCQRRVETSGDNWQTIGSWSPLGGVLTDPRTGNPVLSEGVGWKWGAGFVGDVRVVVTNTVPFSTAITIEMVES